MHKIIAFVLLCLWGATPAFAQQPPVPPPLAVIGGTAVLSATDSSSRVALPALPYPYMAVTVYNKGTADIFVALGDVTVAATASSIPIPAGLFVTLYVGDNTYLAGITASSTASVYLYQATGPVNL